MNIQSVQFAQTHILYDEELLPEFSEAVFEPSSLHSDNKVNRLGRGAAYLFQYRGVDMVLRRYRRGGWMRFINSDYYLFHSLERTRMWREFHMLKQLHQRGLPVPRPIATRCVRRFGVAYSGDLITQTLLHSETVAERLRHSEIADELWPKLGAVIAQFHQAGAYHADLNAHNIMLDKRGQFYLIDFDKGDFRSPTEPLWQQQNLQRLLRSFNKQKEHAPQLHFERQHWQLLLDGYAAAR